MNRFILLFAGYLAAGLLLVRCGQSSTTTTGTSGQAAAAEAAQQATIDSLRAMTEALKPGLGEFMLQLKYHHDRLGEAIKAKDYERAGYETDEMRETAEKIVLLKITNDKLTQPFETFYKTYLQTPLGVLAGAAEKKDAAGLQSNYQALTSNCNSCHHQNNMSFMKIGE